MKQETRLTLQKHDDDDDDDDDDDESIVIKAGCMDGCLIRPVVSYGVEVWTLTKKKEKAVQIYERKILRRIYGPTYENGEWKSRTNRELEEMSKGENIVKWIKGQRISWLGHLERTEEDRMPKKIFTQELEGTRRRGTQEKMERGSRKRSSSAGSEKMERVGGR